MWDARLRHYSALDHLEPPGHPRTRHAILLAAYMARRRERLALETKAAGTESRRRLARIAATFPGLVRRMIGRRRSPAAARR